MLLLLLWLNGVFHPDGHPEVVPAPWHYIQSDTICVGFADTAPLPGDEVEV